MEPGTESLAILFVLVFATLITYSLSNFNMVTLFPGLTAMGAFIILWNFSEPVPIYIRENRCDNCGYWSKEKSKYCPECGKRIV
jgi:reverse gyrase